MMPQQFFAEEKKKKTNVRLQSDLIEEL